MTAVEFLEQEIFRKYKFTLQQLNCQPLEEAIEQAKDMYRTQLIECGNSCALKQHLHIDKINKMTESEIRQFAEEEHLTFGEAYYNETFIIK